MDTGLTQIFDGARYTLRWPERACSTTSERHVKEAPVLSDQILDEDAAVGFLDLIQRMLKIDPAKRITAKEATEHAFFHDCAYATSARRK